MTQSYLSNVRIEGPSKGINEEPVFAFTKIGSLRSWCPIFFNESEADNFYRDAFRSRDINLKGVV
jgi:hypothetical protein